jgi:hypothetical protein
MKGIVKGLVAVGLGLAFVAKPVSAQKPGVEFGLQLAGFSAINPDGADNNTTAFNLAGANASGVGITTSSGVTAAFYLTDMIAIEPGLGYGHIKQDPSTDATSIMNLSIGVPIYLKKGWGKAGGIFVTPYVGMTKISAGGSSTSQNHFGANVGTKMNLAGNFFWRVQVGYDMGMENTGDGIPKSTAFGAALGINYYLH